MRNQPATKRRQTLDQTTIRIVRMVVERFPFGVTPRVYRFEPWAATEKPPAERPRRDRARRDRSSHELLPCIRHSDSGSRGESANPGSACASRAGDDALVIADFCFPGKGLYLDRPKFVSAGRRRNAAAKRRGRAFKPAREAPAPIYIQTIRGTRASQTSDRADETEEDTAGPSSAR
jgi:hypothetical protein